MFSVNAIKPMKQHHIALSSLWMAITLPASAALFPNGDFETPGGASWTEASGGGTYTFDYPTTGGKEGGFGIINHSPTTGGFGIWVGNNETPLTLSSLGLEAGKSYNFTMDMKRLSGSNIGGFKLDFTNGGGPPQAPPTTFVSTSSATAPPGRPTPIQSQSRQGPTALKWFHFGASTPQSDTITSASTLPRSSKIPSSTRAFLMEAWAGLKLGVQRQLGPTPLPEAALTTMGS